MIVAEAEGSVGGEASVPREEDRLRVWTHRTLAIVFFPAVVIAAAIALTFLGIALVLDDLYHTFYGRGGSPARITPRR